MLFDKWGNVRKLLHWEDDIEATRSHSMTNVCSLIIHILHWKKIKVMLILGLWAGIAMTVISAVLSGYTGVQLGDNWLIMQVFLLTEDHETIAFKIEKKTRFMHTVKHNRFKG